MQTRWLTDEYLNEKEVAELTEFYTSCIAQEVWDGRSFNLSLKEEFVTAIEQGTTQFECEKWLASEPAKLERTPGDFLQIGEWPISALAAHRAPIFKQMCVEGGVNNTELLFFKTKAA